jgi:type II secretory pathway pseudopilin PulG
MKKNPSVYFHGSAAFTLVEMIGVMAIIAIMASVIAPNALHSLERAAVRAEMENLHNLGGEIGLYMRDNNGALPTEGSGNWNSQLATYSSLSTADILTNKRGMDRLYVLDPGNATNLANQRALLISSMRNQVVLPTVAQIKASFQNIWVAPENKVPLGAGWGAWIDTSPNSNIEYLVIERVSLASVYRNEFQTYPFTLNNSGAVTVSYKIIYANGASPGVIPMPMGWNTGANPLILKSRDRLNLYSDSAGTTLTYSYVVSNTPKTFTYTTSWVAQ